MKEESDACLPAPMRQVKANALRAIGELEPVQTPGSDESVEVDALFHFSRTNGGRNLPPYYLVYFLLVDLLRFPYLGQREKSAWTVPVRYKGRLYTVEHRKLGLGIFAPGLDLSHGSRVSEIEETDAREICQLIKKGVSVARSYFEWRAEQVVNGEKLNVVNRSERLFERYKYFRDRFFGLCAAYEDQNPQFVAQKNPRGKNEEHITFNHSAYILRTQAAWNGQAAIDAFFSWTEHVFTHLGILQGVLTSGERVTGFVKLKWNERYKTVLDQSNPETASHYQKISALRTQIRNFMAHGAFGKIREAFTFHSAVGAVPVVLTGDDKRRYSFQGQMEFDEKIALKDVEDFVGYLWSGPRAPAKIYLASNLPTNIYYAVNGAYALAMHSNESMQEFVDYLTEHFDRAANMDW